MLIYWFAVLIALLWWYASLVYLRRHRNSAPLPPGPTGLPIVGSLPFLDPELHTYFAALAKTHGPIYSIRLGSKLGVVVSSPALARQVLRDNDAVLANRDVPAVAHIIAYGASDIVWTPNGPTWRMLRRVCVQRMLSPTSLDAVYHLRRREVRSTVRHLLRSAGEPVDVGALVFLSVMNVITSMLWGGTVDTENEQGRSASVGIEFRQLVGEITELLGKPNLSDFFPGLARFDLQGILRKMRVLLERFDRIFATIIEQRRKVGKSTGAKDMLEFMLQLEAEGVDGNVPFTMTHVKALLMMEPGPISTNVLYQQSHHRSRKIESGEDPGVVTLIDHARSHQDWPLVDARVRVLVGRAGFLACSQLSWIRLDWSLITALLERWRPETETFHLRVGEMTVTLQDVAVLLGLRIDGHPVTGTDDRIWSDVCRTGLGRVPPLTGGCIRLRWLRETFQQVPANAGANRVRWHARAYILHMIGTLLFPDSNKGTVHARWLPLLQDFDVCGTLSWGSAVLAYLYKELAKVSLMETKELHACITLLQAWSWEHIGVGRPALVQTRELNGQIPLACRWNVERSYAKMPNREIRLYRNELDVMEPTQVIWEPYTHDVLQLLPPICTEGVAIWRARVPLICFEIVEMHVPDRVLRQFGLAQHIPDAIVPIARRDRQGRPRANWALEHACFAVQWNQRADHIQDQRHPATQVDEYIYWYWGITRRWIITRADPPITYMPRGYIERDMISELEQVEGLADQGMRAYNLDDTRSLFRDIANRCRSVLQRARVIRPAPPRPPVRFVYTRQRRHLRLTDVSADVGPSQRRDDNALAIVTQPHTQPDPEILHAQRGGERRVPRMLACLR